MPECLILTTFSWPFAQYCRKTLLFHGVLSEKLSILPPGCTDKSLDKLPYTCDNIHIVRNKEEKKMFILECFAVLVVIAILITPTPTTLG